MAARAAGTARAGAAGAVTELKAVPLQSEPPSRRPSWEVTDEETESAEPAESDRTTVLFDAPEADADVAEATEQVAEAEEPPAAVASPEPALAEEAPLFADASLNDLFADDLGDDVESLYDEITAEEGIDELDAASAPAVAPEEESDLFGELDEQEPAPEPAVTAEAPEVVVDEEEEVDEEVEDEELEAEDDEEYEEEDDEEYEEEDEEAELEAEGEEEYDEEEEEEYEDEELEAEADDEEYEEEDEEGEYEEEEGELDEEEEVEEEDEELVAEEEDELAAEDDGEVEAEADAGEEIVLVEDEVEDHVLTPAAAPAAKADEPEPAAAPAVAEDVIYEAGLLFLREKRVAVSMLQRTFSMEFKDATAVLDRLQELGLIGPYLGGRTREILLDEAAWEELAAPVRG